jgi:hypothetical protein
MTTGKTGHDISGPGNELLQEAFRDYSQHLVGLSLLEVSPDKEPLAHFASGFLMEFGKDLYWVTAGHILEAIEEHLKLGTYERFRLIDNFGFGSDKNAIPFEYASTPRYFVNDIDDEGLDFGVVQIAPFYRSHLEANRDPILAESDWRSADYTSFRHNIILGLPEDSIERRVTLRPESLIVHGKPVPSMVMTSRLDSVPPQFQKPNSRLVGAVSPKWPEGTIAGMSGGPIFGVDANNVRSHIVAIQSSWDVPSRISFGCPISVFAPMVEEAIKTGSVSVPGAQL